MWAATAVPATIGVVRRIDFSKICCGVFPHLDSGEYARLFLRASSPASAADHLHDLCVEHVSFTDGALASGIRPDNTIDNTWGKAS